MGSQKPRLPIRRENKMKVKMSISTKRQKTKARKVYLLRFLAGLCPKCGGQRTGTWITCIKCLDTAREYRKSIPVSVYSTNNQRYRKKCRSNGQCPICGTDNPGKFIHCKKCRDKGNERQIRYLINKYSS